MYKLQIRDDEGRTTVVPLLRDEVTIGRKEGNTIRLTERNVSRRHARLLKKNGKVWIEDLSRYGTRINGRRISDKTSIEPGDSILIGDYELSLEADGAAASAGVSPDAAAAPASVGPEPATKPGKDGESTALVSADMATEIDRPAAAPQAGAAAGRPRLVCVASSLAGSEYKVEKDDVTIGRTEDNDIVVDHRSISRQHARLSTDGTNWTISDLDSANGLKVNGEDYKQATLRRGDIVELGHVKLRFVEPGEAFVYDAGVEAAGEKKGGKPVVVLVALVLAAAALAVAWFGYFSKPLESGAAEKEAPAVAAAETKKTEPATEPKTVSPAEPAQAAAEAPEAKPAAGGDAAADLEAAKGHLKAERWDEAITGFQAALEKDPESTEAKAGLLMAENEKKAGATYQEVSELMKAGDVEGAFEKVEALGGIPSTSAYHGRATELRTAIESGFVGQLIDKGWKYMTKQKFSHAMAAAEKALAIDPRNDEARKLFEAAKKKAKETEPETKAEVAKAEAAKEKEKEKPKEEPPPKETEGATTDFYAEARKLHNSNPAEAMKLYEKAAAKGNAKAWRQLGSLHIQQGNKAKAIEAYTKYLKLAPGAPDAEVIRNTIIRLGGTPP
jgi:pSer/pThr/pTyr-binding forkhead associated (FHA) protein/Tfp pilus assembly protein PilF